MHKPILDKNALAKWLGDVISAEMSKSDDDINWELVDECEAYLTELYSDVEISEEQIKQNIAKIKGMSSDTKAPQQTRRKPRMRRLTAAALAAALIVSCGISVYAFVPSVRDMINIVLKLPVGSKIDDGGITFTYAGKTTTYNSIDELMQNENLDIMYPHKLPDGLKIKYVTCTGEGENFMCTITFADGMGSVNIKAYEIDVSKINKNAIIYENPYNVKYYITDDGVLYTAISAHNGWTYNLSTYSMEQLTELLDNIY